ncbi:HaeIII family restriction endonuclease [Helicobacter heilmannii]|uniref:HaeIII family restriction endonuclease n=1 Tax=Helicobacter heilmannii TaxID=35817 RepID=UPI000A0150FE
MFGKNGSIFSCSQAYWDTTLSIFEKLESYEIARVKWRNILRKSIEIYMPLLNVMMVRILRHKNNKASLKTSQSIL